MKLIGFSRRKLSAEMDLKLVLDAIAPIFGTTGFRFTAETEVKSEDTVPFDFESGLRLLQKQKCLGFCKENTASVWIDNQSHEGRYFIYPHSTLEIDEIGLTEADPSRRLQIKDWLIIAEHLLGNTAIELGIVLGRNEDLADYWRTPLGVGVGLIKVYWILCFGEAYSRLANPEGRKTSFFSRNEFGTGLKTFVSASSYEAYRSAPAELLAVQRAEIGDDLFNRLPVEERRGGADASWIFNPKNIIRFLTFLYRQRTTNWRKFQAKTVPEHYRKV
jgi:hypothetical protein